MQYSAQYSAELVGVVYSTACSTVRRTALSWRVWCVHSPACKVYKVLKLLHVMFLACEPLAGGGSSTATCRPAPRYRVFRVSGVHELPKPEQSWVVVGAHTGMHAT